MSTREVTLREAEEEYKDLLRWVISQESFTRAEAKRAFPKMNGAYLTKRLNKLRESKILSEIDKDGQTKRYIVSTSEAEPDPLDEPDADWPWDKRHVSSKQCPASNLGHFSVPPVSGTLSDKFLSSRINDLGAVGRFSLAIYVYSVFLSRLLPGTKRHHIIRGPRRITVHGGSVPLSQTYLWDSGFTRGTRLLPAMMFVLTERIAGTIQRVTRGFLPTVDQTAARNG